ncbi:inositol monophosphatase family protein [Micropruina sp.]|uniref:inositol monophosphatase family protein n=1 Tax=Micropruina sp. TaxID=2737536 RepID=UPI0039E70587
MQTDAVTAAIRQVCDAEIMPRFRSLADDEIIEKRPGDVVTVADRLAEQELAAIFTAADPGCLVVGEEGVYADPSGLKVLPHAERAWVIDPVDGTRNFTEGSADFAVMVAEVRAGETTRSWIWQPVHDRMYVAEKGAGVYLNDVRVAVSPIGERLVGALHGRYGHPRARMPDTVTLTRLAGCCGVDYPLVVERERAFLGYWSMHPWDHLPGGLMVTEAGGRLATIDGRDYAAGVTGRYLLAAASDQLWELAAGLVREQFAL